LNFNRGSDKEMQYFDLILIEKDLTVNRVNYCVTRWKDKKEKKRKEKL
jgi:hypothetical protein